MYRKILGFTQAELAQKSGLSEMSIRRYESGERSPNAAAIRSLSDVFGISISDFMGIGRWEIRLNDEENALFGLYERLADRDKSILITLLKRLSESGDNEIGDNKETR